MTKPTSVEAAHPPRHGFTVDVSVLFRRTPVFCLLVMIQADLSHNRRPGHIKTKGLLLFVPLYLGRYFYTPESTQLKEEDVLIYALSFQ